MLVYIYAFNTFHKSYKKRKKIIYFAEETKK